MSVKRLHTRQKLLVVPQGDEDLMVIPNCLQQYRQRTLRDLLLLELSNLSFIKFRLRDIGQITTEIGVRREIVPGEDARTS